CGGEQDMRKMGGLKRHMPTTYWTFLVATIAIAGIFPFAGFFSKDEILAKAFAAGFTNLNGFGTVYALLWVLALAGAVLTAFYMFRLVYMTFHGDFRGGHEAEHHLHESPWTMTMPLQVLGVLSIVGGFLGFPGQLFGRPELNRIEQFMEPVILPIGHTPHGAEHAAHHVPLSLELGLILLSLAVAGFGIWMAFRFYSGARAFERPRRLAERFPLAYKLLLNKYWVDELYDATVISGTAKLANLLWEADARVVDGAVNGTRHLTVGTSFLSGIFDLRVVDGAVNLVARAYDVASVAFRRLQVGFTQGYAMVMVFGAAILLVVFLVSF
ncbi:MAG TPA: proton-conducting transporter membrane subunit, partial [Thermoanaerobaculales bacterium]|nr:proton-conducting transporter membrane subunit [Thermoanaerobaculales bacterium]